LIIKPRGIPLRIEQNAALLRRLVKHHPKRLNIEEDLSKRIAGFRGEQRIDYQLKLLPQEDYDLFFDLRLTDHIAFFQLDTLIVSPYFCAILEVKNISGTLQFDSQFQQMIRIYDEKEERFPNPVLQVKRQQLQFERWLALHQLPPVPIEYAAVISNSSTILKSSSNSRFYDEKRMILDEGILDQIGKWSKMYKKRMLSLDNLNRLKKLLLKHHSPYQVNILTLYNIDSKDILRGVICPKCSHGPMKRIFGKWHCSNCLTSSKSAHIQALYDYFLLFQPTITNKQLRSFLLIHDRHHAKYLLKQLHLTSKGHNKDRVYFLHEELFSQLGYSNVLQTQKS
jgi:hypothetical protein